MNKSKRENLGGGILKMPLLKLSINHEIKKLLKEFSWLNGDRKAVTLRKNNKLRVILI